MRLAYVLVIVAGVLASCGKQDALSGKSSGRDSPHTTLQATSQGLTVTVSSDSKCSTLVLDVRDAGGFLTEGMSAKTCGQEESGPTTSFLLGRTRTNAMLLVDRAPPCGTLRVGRSPRLLRPATAVCDGIGQNRTALVVLPRQAGPVFLRGLGTLRTLDIGRLRCPELDSLCFIELDSRGRSSEP